MKQPPLVSVLILCYNHAPFVAEAIQSVLDQDYPAIEIIVCDDGSQDESREVITALAREHPEIRPLLSTQNKGYTSTFNEAFAQSKGAFIIDLAADDILLPQRIAQQVALFGQSEANVGVVYSNARYRDAQGKAVHLHFGPPPAKVPNEAPPSGDLYERLLRGYLIAAPTMMIRREVLESLGGYDVSLDYEDFDFWVRSARHWHYAYLDSVTTGIRLLSDSLSARQYRPDSKQLEDTLRICRKAQTQNTHLREDRALIARLRYEYRQSLLCGHESAATDFYKMLEEMGGADLLSRALHFLAPLLLHFGRQKA